MKQIPGVAPAARADAGKKHLIVSERKDKKAAKYLVRDLPYPYTSAAQYERSMERPLGAEWNTRVGFQRATLPKVVKKVRGLYWGTSELWLTGDIDGHGYRTIGEAAFLRAYSNLPHHSYLTYALVVQYMYACDNMFWSRCWRGQHQIMVQRQ